MKELSNDEVNGLLLVSGHDWKAAIRDAYRLGQRHGIDPLRFQAACAALTGYRSRQTNATPKEIAQACRMDADALIAELNRTASDAEKGTIGRLTTLSPL